MEKVKLNIVPKGKKSTCYASQNDNGRVVRFELFNELIPYILDGSETISIKVVRPDSEEILASIENTFEGKAYIDVVFNTNMTEIAGVGECEITITDGETVLGSRNFDMNIEIDAYNGRDVIIETSTGTLAEFDTEVEDNALEYESEIPYKADGYTGLRVINTRTAPVYDKAPYIYRETPAGAGNSCIEKLNGLTVAFNQLVQNGNFANDSIWSWSSVYSHSVTNNIATITFKDQAYNHYINQNVNIIANHYYFVTATVQSSDKTNGLKFNFYTVSSTIQGFSFNGNISTKTVASVICKPTENCTNIMYRFSDGAGGGTATIENCMIIDLTQMFRSTIADYLYNLETQTAGAGVQKFKELGFDKSYFDYNAGSLLSSIPVAKRVIGKNLFGYDLSDATSGAKYIQIKVPNGTYTMSTSAPLVEGAAILFFMAGYQTSGVSTGTNGVSNGISRTVTTTDGYITFAYRYIGTPSVYPADFNTQIEIGSTATAYQPYEEDIYNLGGDTLRGLLKLDSNNNIYADGDIKTSDGKIKRRYGAVDLGSLEWNLRNTNIFEDGGALNGIIRANAGNWQSVTWVLCARYDVLPYYNGTGSEDVVSTNKTIGFVFTDISKIVIHDNSFSDAATLKAALNGVYLVFELKNYGDESADPFTDPQKAGSIEEIIDGNMYNIVDLGSLEWSKAGSSDTLFATNDLIGNIKGADFNNETIKAYCLLYTATKGISVYTSAVDKSIGCDANGRLYIYDSDKSDLTAAQFKAAMSGVYLYYEKASSEGIEIALGHNSIYGTDIEYQDIDFNTTIYGGEIDAVNGVLSSEYNADGSVKPTPEIIDITPTPIPVKAGDNKIFNNANGNQTIRYYNQVEE